MTDAIHEQVARVRVWYNLVADAFAHRYDDRSGWYFERCEEDLLHDALELDDRRVLDLGTGAGRLLPRLAARARSVTGVDISESLLRRSPRAPRTAIAQMDALDLGFRDGSFDAVVSLGLFEYVTDLGPFLKEIGRVLRPGGQIAFTYHQVVSYRQKQAEAPETPYFGKTIGERSRYWSKARHRRGEIERALGQHGFSAVRRYRAFFRIPALIYAQSCRSAPGSFGERLLRLGVVASDRVCGRALRPITQFGTGNVLMVAVKTP
jgi:SAM-dependent methyltransferase